MIFKPSMKTFKDKTSFEGDAIENLTSQVELHQVIKEPTNILHISF